MSENALVSIIVPVYGVEDYLAACVDSLLSQTYNRLEIILVDDASPDRCGEICDHYAMQDCRIKVIHKQNGGAASARNAGLDAATGDFICFVDSDDLVSPDYVQHLYDHLMCDGADIAVCGFSQFTRTGSQPCLQTEPVAVYERNEYLLEFLKHWTCSLLWNKIYRAETIGNLRMAEGHRIDDEFFTYQVVLNAKTIVVFEEPLYSYRLRASSVMQNLAAYEEKVMFDRLEYIQQRYAHIKTQAPELECAYFVDMLDSLTRYWGACQHLPNIQKIIVSCVKLKFIHIIQAKIPIKQKLTYLYKLFICSPGSNPLSTGDINVGDDLYT